MMSAYLDCNATTQPLPEVVAAMVESLERGWGNPSSVHRAGIDARHAVELARESVARLLGAQPREVTFTSGGTESASLAIAGTLDALAGPRTVISMRTEHSAVREACEALESRGRARVRCVPPAAGGLSYVAALDAALDAHAGDVALVSVMWTNNETGVVQPVHAVGERCRARGVRFHCDATQWVGRMPTALAGVPVDLVTLSAHKFHGPKGVGALWVRGGVRVARSHCVLEGRADCSQVLALSFRLNSCVQKKRRFRCRSLRCPNACHQSLSPRKCQPPPAHCFFKWRVGCCKTDGSIV
jgi:cysteine desulfurase